MKNKIFKGTIILVIAGIFVKILGALYRIPLSNILGAEGIGLYQMIFPIFSLTLIISSSGVSTTLSILIAKARAEKNKNIKTLLVKGFLYSFFFSLIFAGLFFLFADKIAILQGNSETVIGYQVMTIALVFASLLSPFRGYFQGYSNMFPTAISQMLEQFFKVFFGLFFAIVLIDKGIEFGVAGAFLGIGISEAIALLYLWIKFLFFKKTKTFNKNNVHNKKKKETSQKISLQKFTNKKNTSFMKMNFSITISFLIIPLILTFDSFVVVNLLNLNFPENISTSLYGLQSGLVNSLINFPIIVSMALSLSLLPTLTFLISKKKINKAYEKLSNIFKSVWIIALPCVSLFIIFPELIMKILYNSISSQQLSIASKLLQISAFEILFISLLQVSIAIFQSINKEKIPILLLFISGIIKIFLTIILVRNPSINIYGVAIANLIFYASSAIISLLLIKREFKFYFDLKFFTVCFLSILITSIMFYIINVFIMDFWTKLSLIAIVLIIFYILPLFIFRIIDFEKVIMENIKNLKKTKKNKF